MRWCEEQAQCSGWRSRMPASSPPNENNWRPRSQDFYFDGHFARQSHCVIFWSYSAILSAGAWTDCFPWQVEKHRSQHQNAVGAGCGAMTSPSAWAGRGLAKAQWWVYFVLEGFTVHIAEAASERGAASCDSSCEGEEGGSWTSPCWLSAMPLPSER